MRKQPVIMFMALGVGVALAAAEKGGEPKGAAFSPKPHFTNGLEIPGSAAGSAVYDLAVGDFNGDGHKDLIIVHGGTPTAGPRQLFLGNGTAKPFEGVKFIELPGGKRDTRAVAIGDFNKDGKPDYVMGCAGGTTGRNLIALATNNGTAKPYDKEVPAALEMNCKGIAAADMNGDGLPDIVTGDGSGKGHPALLLNKGDGTFEAKAIAPADKWMVYPILVADANGDGRPDLVTGAGNNAERPKLYLNNGTADPFKDVAGYFLSPGRDHHYRIAMGDVNGDGKPDLVMGGSTPRLWLNTGRKDEPFDPKGGVAVGSAPGSAVALGDVDGDGKVDLVAGSFGETGCSTPPLLFLNNGTGEPFKDVEPQLLVDDPHDKSGLRAKMGNDVWRIRVLMLEDMDKDGALDLILMNKWGGSAIFMNPRVKARKEAAK